MPYSWRTTYITSCVSSQRYSMYKYILILKKEGRYMTCMRLLYKCRAHEEYTWTTRSSAYSYPEKTNKIKNMDDRHAVCGFQFSRRCRAWALRQLLEPSTRCRGRASRSCSRSSTANVVNWDRYRGMLKIPFRVLFFLSI